MDISVENIHLNHGINKLSVTVEFRQETTDGCVESASVIVFLHKRDGAALAEIESAGTHSAFEFLTNALAARV